MMDDDDYSAGYPIYDDDRPADMLDHETLVARMRKEPGRPEGRAHHVQVDDPRVITLSRVPRHDEEVVIRRRRRAGERRGRRPVTRVPVRMIAAALGVSTATVARRIARAEIDPCDLLALSLYITAAHAGRSPQDADPWDV